MQFTAGTIDGDCFILTPAVVFTLGRCECCGEAHGIMISLDWLRWQVAIVVPFFTGGH